MPASAGAVAVGAAAGVVATVAGAVTAALAAVAALAAHADVDFDSQACVPSHAQMDAITTSAPPNRSGWKAVAVRLIRVFSPLGHGCGNCGGHLCGRNPSVAGGGRQAESAAVGAYGRRVSGT